MMKNALYFISKALYFLKIFKFVLTFWLSRKSRMIKKVRLISNFIMSQPGYQTIAIYILLNIA